MKTTPQFLSRNTVPSVVNYIKAIVEEGNYKVSFKPVAQRTLDMNDKIHAMCTDISQQVALTDKGYELIPVEKLTYGGTYFNHTDWKHILMAGYAKAETVPGLERDQVVCLYPSTTDLSFKRGMEFIDYIYAYGNDMGVEWTEPES